MFSSEAQVYNSLIWADEFNLDQSSELRISLSSSSTEMLSIKKIHSKADLHRGQTLIHFWVRNDYLAFIFLNIVAPANPINGSFLRLREVLIS